MRQDANQEEVVRVQDTGSTLGDGHGGDGDEGAEKSSEEEEWAGVGGWVGVENLAKSATPAMSEASPQASCGPLDCLFGIRQVFPVQPLLETSSNPIGDADIDPDTTRVDMRVNVYLTDETPPFVEDPNVQRFLGLFKSLKTSLSDLGVLEHDAVQASPQPLGTPTFLVSRSAFLSLVHDLCTVSFSLCRFFARSGEEFSPRGRL